MTKDCKRAPGHNEAHTLWCPRCKTWHRWERIRAPKAKP